MINCQNIGPMPTIICVQPHCCLKKAGLDMQDVTKVLLLALAGKSTKAVISQSPQIEPRPQCEQCLERVLNGGKAFLTQPEWDHLNYLGDWHRRRQRRRYH